MNERIKELLEHVGVKYIIAPDNTIYEKFAELIVRDCIDCIKMWRDAEDEEMKKDPDPYWNGYRAGCDDGIVEIQQKFGIE